MKQLHKHLFVYAERENIRGERFASDSDSVQNVFREKDLVLNTNRDEELKKMEKVQGGNRSSINFALHDSFRCDTVPTYELDLESVEKQVKVQLKVRELLSYIDRNPTIKSMDTNTTENSLNRKAPSVAEVALLVMRKREMLLEIEAAKILISEKEKLNNGITTNPV